ncbi:MAG: FxsA family protein, partial [Arenicellales bacterium]
FRSATEAGELPAITIIEGLALLVAGALLLTPGFFTDAIGFVLLTPPLRQILIRRWFSSRVEGMGSATRRKRDSGVVEGEFRRLDD